MKKCVMIICALVVPRALFAQGILAPMQQVLDHLYEDMMPGCARLIGAARIIGGFGALWYIGARVWRHIAHAEPIDMYGLLRPFAIGMCILLFPSVINIINTVMQPTVAGTAAMAEGSENAVREYLKHKESSMFGLGVLNPSNWIHEGLKALLELVFEAAGFIINVIRTFYLIVLAIIGPIVFALSIYDGFQHLLTVWLARYINVFLWLPVANIFGAIIFRIQRNMIMNTISGTRLPAQVFSTTDWTYLAFLLIGIVGYFTVPSVANYIVNAGGGNALLHKVSTLASATVSKTASTAMSGMSADVFGNGAANMSSSMSDAGMTRGYFKDKLSGK